MTDELMMMMVMVVIVMRMMRMNPASHPSFTNRN